MDSNKDRTAPVRDGSRTVSMQCPVILHKEQTAVVEVELDLPEWFQPTPGCWLFHKDLNGLMPIANVICDTVESRLVLCSGLPVHDPTSTLKEWLAERPKWVEAVQPFVITHKKE